jgi:20S proteasome alpha/beta subunit
LYRSNLRKSIVVAADRMMTYGAPMNLQVEAAVRKIIPLSDNAVLLFSGSVPDGEGIANGTKSKMQGGQFGLKQVADFAAARNTARARIKWMFTTDKARAKLGHAYPDTAKES